MVSGGVVLPLMDAVRRVRSRTGGGEEVPPAGVDGSD
jgi:hypothetical protein